MGNRESIMHSLNSSNSNDNLEPLKVTNLPIIFILGGPGAGKGEPHPVGYSREGEAILSRYWLPQGIQCEKIAKKYDFLHVSSGNLVRDEIESKSERGITIDRLLADGQFLPMNIILDLIKEKMENSLSNTKGYVLEGFPREKIQGKLFEKLIRPPNIVIYLKVDEKILKERLQGRAVTSGRKEDNDDVITQRIKLFLRKNNALLKYYDKKLSVIDAERDVEHIFNDVCDVIEKQFPNNTKCDKLK